MNTQKWNKLFDFDYKYVDSTLSSNENYVIIAGGYEKFGQKRVNNKIFVLDLTNEAKYKLKECKIQIPRAGPCLLITINIKCEILVIGWIKELFKTEQFKNIILNQYIYWKMISLWYDQEMIHWLDTNYCDNPLITNDNKKDDICNHQKIKLKHILSIFIDLNQLSK